MNIRQAMASPDLFGPLFPPRSSLTPDWFVGDTWTRWRVFMASLFGLQLTDEELAVFRHHTGLRHAPTAAVKKAALICGRRTGKSRVLATLAVYHATIQPQHVDLAPGETPTVLVIASDKKQARAIFRYVRGLLNSVAVLRPLIQTESSDSITLSTGVAIEVLAANYRTLRGYTLIIALCDEVAFWRDEDSANPDEEIINALEPALGTLDGPILLASSPYAKRGVLYKTFRENFGVEGGEYLVWRGTTAELNPDFPTARIKKRYEEDAVAAASEYGAEFRSDLSTFVAREVVEGCTEPGRYEMGYHSGHQYLAFVDPSGGSSDSMTLAIAHHEGDSSVLDVVREAHAPFSPDAVVREFADLLKAYKVQSVTGDRYAGEFPRELFRNQGISYVLSERPKSDMYRELLPLLNAGRVELLDIQRLSSQLCSLERRTARGGKDSIDHPPRCHDDVANAAAGALLLAGKPNSLAIWLALAA